MNATQLLTKKKKKKPLALSVIFLVADFRDFMKNI
jgi:hypothetical protein